tara:strand:- start:84 stop:869 length:786 start_codon:yes stop_codon:yes gene_type:complete
MVDLFRRINFRHFQQDNYPTKEKIEEILQEAINIAPVDKEFFSWRLEVHGPEYAEQKAELVLDCSTFYTKDDNGVDLTPNTYIPKYGEEQWDDQIRKAYKRRPGSFNCQTQAPYLITVVCHKSIFDDEDPDNYVGYKPERTHPGMPSYRHCMNMGIFIHSVALAANNHDVDFAFCCCLQRKRNPIVRSIKKNEGEKFVVFLGLGYFDWSLAGTEGYDDQFVKTDDPDIVRRRTGGVYNIKEHTRTGFKTKKPRPDQIISWM